ncbi:uncharacterized protein LOC122029661 [Zingiber officinale]|uniref:uncharacterized protein LOC122029661 n=1 Tax=Zingiber officinale TaxID=94328 RepID=UPI001C4D28A9|nr:uncharacterized protein LOC122029661 [Zingiber officinale]
MEGALPPEEGGGALNTALRLSQHYRFSPATSGSRWRFVAVEGLYVITGSVTYPAFIDSALGQDHLPSCTRRCPHPHRLRNLFTPIYLSSSAPIKVRLRLARLRISSISSQRSRVEATRRRSTEQERRELDELARRGETVVPGGTGGKSLETQEHLAEGRSRGGQARKEQLGTEGYQELGHKGGETRREQMGHEGYQEMDRKGGLSTKEEFGGERAAKEGIPIDESKYKTKH